MLGIGTVLNIPDPAAQNAVLLPQTEVRFLGLIVDAAQQQFKLPDDKKNRT